MKNYWQRFDHFLNSNFLYKCLFIIGCMALAQLVLNLIKHQPLWRNMSTPLFVAGMYLAADLLAKTKWPQVFQFAVVFVVIFSYGTIQMFRDGSYVDYTSLVIGGVVSLFMAGAVSVVAWSIKKNERK